MVSFRLLTLASWYQTGAAVFFVLLSAVLWPDRLTAVIAGGAVMVLNFWAMRFFMVKAFGGAKPKLAYALVLAVKFVVVLGVLAALVLLFELDPLGIALGLSTLFLGIGLGSAHQAFTVQAPSAASTTHKPS